MFVKEKYIGGGGFGRVYLVNDVNGNSFALKELNLDAYIHDSKLADNISRRFVQEAVKQSEIDHRNVIKVIHQKLDSSPPYFVMELAEFTFEKLILDFHSGVASLSQIKAGLFDILSGLNALHEVGIWHRDLKPQNVLFVSPDRFAISDFGLIAVRDSGATTLTLTGTTAGSKQYAPPEFMMNFKKASASSDIYSFGAILHDVFLNKSRVPYSELKDGTGKIGSVISKCTKLKQYNRYKNIEELRAELFEAILEIESRGGTVNPAVDLSVFSSSALNEDTCDLVIDLIEGSDSDGLYLIYKCISIDFINVIYTASREAADHIAELYALYVFNGTFDFNYCDVLADRLVCFHKMGSVATKSLCLLALLQLGVSHHRWYVARRFLANLDRNSDPNVAKRFIIDAKVNGVDLSYRLPQLLRSISASKKELNLLIEAMIEDINE